MIRKFVESAGIGLGLLALIATGAIAGVPRVVVIEDYGATW